MPFSKHNSDWAKDAGTPVKPFKDEGALWLRAPATDPISSKRIKKLVRAFEAAKFPTGKEPKGPRPYIDYKRKRICYIPPEDDIRPLMMMQQMIADSYADARIVWDLNGNRARQADDHLGMYGPNDVQRGIEERLMQMRLLSRPALDAVIYREAPEPPPASSRLSRCLRIKIGKKPREDDDDGRDPRQGAKCRLSKKLWRALRSRFKSLNIAERPQVFRQEPREYLPYAVVHRPELPAIACFTPCIRPKLRRTTRADAHRLRLSSIRYVLRRRTTLPQLPPPVSVYIAPEFKHWGPIDYKDLMSLPWPKREVEPIVNTLIVPAPFVAATEKMCTDEKQEEMPFHIMIGIFLFWISVSWILFFGFIFAVIWGCFSIVTGFFFSPLEED